MRKLRQSGLILRMLENMICDSIQQLLGNKELNYSENGIVEKIKLSTFKEKQEV